MAPLVQVFSAASINPSRRLHGGRGIRFSSGSRVGVPMPIWRRVKISMPGRGRGRVEVSMLGRGRGMIFMPGRGRVKVSMPGNGRGRRGSTIIRALWVCQALVGNKDIGVPCIMAGWMNAWDPAISHVPVNCWSGLMGAARGSDQICWCRSSTIGSRKP